MGSKPSTAAWRPLRVRRRPGVEGIGAVWGGEQLHPDYLDSLPHRRRRSAAFASEVRRGAPIYLVEDG